MPIWPWLTFGEIKHRASWLRDLRMAVERRTTLGIGGPVLVDPDTHGALDAIERRMGRD